MQSHAESALQQLAAVREQEQLQLARRAEALQRDLRESIAELEHRYALQVGRSSDTTPVLGRQHSDSHLWETNRRWTVLEAICSLSHIDLICSVSLSEL